MKKLILTSIFTLLCANASFAQGYTKFDCSLSAGNFDSPNREVMRNQPLRELGSFKVDGTMEEERIIKYFRLPKTKWFVVASLYTTDESMASKSGIGSFFMELSLSTKRKRNVFTSPAFAASETPFITFDVGRVSMVIKAGGHRQMVIMECKATKQD